MSAQEREPDLLPAGLRERVMEASRQARAAGRSVPKVIEISPVEAFSRAVDAFYGLLCALDEADWARATVRDLDVQTLMGHLIGVEEDVCLALVGDRSVADADHVESTQPAALRQVGRDPAQTRTEWREATLRTIEMVQHSGDIDREIALHGMRPTVGVLLVIRAFELWTHDNDVRRATGLPLSVPDPSTLALTTALAARLVPFSADRAGQRERIDLHLVLTGPGGGTWDLEVGDDASEPVAISIITDAAGFCRLAANRVTQGEMDVHVVGDADRAALVLAAVSTLALD